MKRTRQLRTVIYLLSAAAIIAAIWGLAVTHERDENARRLHADAEVARRSAVFFERHALSILRYADAYVRLVRREYAEHHDLDRVLDLLEQSPLDTTIVSHVTIIDAQGTPVLVSGHRVRPGSSAADRDYFIEQRDSEGDQVLVSLPSVGRNSGKLIFRLVRRISGPDGAFAGVVFAAIDAAAVTGFFDALDLGPRSSATLVGTDRRIRARSAWGRAGPGQDISGSRIWRELERSPTGLYLQTSVVDQVTRQYAYRALSDFPLVVAVGVALDGAAGSGARTTEYNSPYPLAALGTALLLTVALLLWRETLTSTRLAASEEHVRSINALLEQRVEERTAQLEKVQEELLRKERLAVLGQLTGTVAHELRNPLSTITIAAALVERRAGLLDAELGEALPRLRRSVERCNRIISELLDYARSRGIQALPTELDRWLAEALEGHVLPDGVNVTISPGAPGVVLAFDRERMRRAVVNLVDNACDALTQDGREGGLIELSTCVRPARVEIAVRDDGPGIAQEVVARVREPLFSTKSFGVGLGVPIVNQIMEAHGGGLEIDTREGHGTRMVLWLPVAPAAAPDPAPAS